MKVNYKGFLHMPVEPVDPIAAAQGVPAAAQGVHKTLWVEDLSVRATVGRVFGIAAAHR
jgi:hypothetical protein